MLSPDSACGNPRVLDFSHSRLQEVSDLFHTTVTDMAPRLESPLSRSDLSEGGLWCLPNVRLRLILESLCDPSEPE